jgi:hypothetical protein
MAEAALLIASGDVSQMADVLTSGSYVFQNQLISEQRQPMDIQASTWPTVKEAARYLSVKPRTLAQWARQGTTKDYVLSGTDLLSLQLFTRTETWRINSGHRSSKDSLAASISP